MPLYKEAKVEMLDNRNLYNELDQDPSRTGNDPWGWPVLHGTLKKIQLWSDHLSYGPEPKPDDEIEQHLTIRGDGRVWLSRYHYGTEKRVLFEKRAFRIDASAAKTIMDAFSEYFGSPHMNEMVTDCGSWEAWLTNDWGVRYKESGSLCDDIKVSAGGLSAIIRSALGMEDLFVFDGGSEQA